MAIKAIKAIKEVNYDSENTSYLTVLKQTIFWYISYKCEIFWRNFTKRYTTQIQIFQNILIPNCPIKSKRKSRYKSKSIFKQQTDLNNHN